MNLLNDDKFFHNFITYIQIPPQYMTFILFLYVSQNVTVGNVNCRRDIHKPNAAIHLFISSHDEIIDFCSMDKKTGRRYVQRVKLFNHNRIYVFVYLYSRRRNVIALTRAF